MYILFLTQGNYETLHHLKVQFSITISTPYLLVISLYSVFTIFILHDLLDDLVHTHNINNDTLF